MRTDARGLLDAGTQLAKLAWDDAGANEVWGDRDRYILHQVSAVHTNAMIDVLGIDPSKVPTVFGHEMAGTVTAVGNGAG